jgi:drug/metabolite transporter (DMT)-like permease
LIKTWANCRANAHIRVLFSALVARARSSFGPDEFFDSALRPAEGHSQAPNRRPFELTSYTPELTKADGRSALARADRPFRGIALIIGSTVFLACSDAMAKYLSLSLPAIEIAWIRFLVFALIVLPAALTTAPNAFRSTRPGLQAWRAVALLSSSVFFITGLRYLPIAEASATSFVAPIFVTALSMMFLGEKVGVRRWLATIVGLFGVMIIVRPGSSAFDPAALFPVVSAFGWACTLIMTRMISGKDRAITTMVYSSLVGLCILTAMVPLFWVTPSWREIVLGVAVGIASTTGQWIVVLAFRYADASVLAPFSYGQLVWATILGFLIFGDIPDFWTIVGAAVIIGSGLYTAHRERVRRAQLPIQAEPYPSA